MLSFFALFRNKPLLLINHQLLLAVATFGLISTQPVMAQAPAKEGVIVGKKSIFTKLVPADQIERQAHQDFVELLQDASSQGALMRPENPTSQRVIAITQKMLPYAKQWNARAKNWQWNIALVKSDQVNALCMPGGKIVIFTGLVDKLQLSDDELAMVIGHEISHALREHSNEQIGKDMARRATVSGIASMFELGQLSTTLLDMGSQVYSLKFSRDDETEADLVGLDLAARAGFDPRASLTLWRKMAANSGGQPLEWLSTHPKDEKRYTLLQKNIPKVLPIYAKAKGMGVVGGTSTTKKP